MVVAPRWIPVALLGLLTTGVALRGGAAPDEAALLCLLTGAIGLVAASDRRLPTLSPAVWGLALLCSGAALASILWSRHADVSRGGSAAVLSASLVWMLGATLVDGKARHRFAVGLATSGAVVALMVLAKATPGQPDSILLGDPNHLAAWLLLPGSLALVALLVSEPTRRGSLESAFLWFGLVGIIGAGIAATASRGAGLAAALALATLLILYALGPRRGILAGASGIVAVALIPSFAPAFAPDLPQVGLPFLAVFVVTAVVAVCASRQVLSRSRGPRLTWGALTAVLGLCACSLVDFPLHVPAIALSGAALAGMAFAGSTEHPRPDRVRSGTMTRLTLAGVSIALLALVGSRGVSVFFAESTDQRVAAVVPGERRSSVLPPGRERSEGRALRLTTSRSSLASVPVRR